ncbi:MAG: hypothetical protein ACLQL2_10805 [Methylovirgula sp.]
MDLDKLFTLVEKLRFQAIGNASWRHHKRVYEYDEHSAKVVAVLKLVRAAQGLKALKLLCGSGLFLDLGVIIRCVNDCNSEVYFLLEEFPNASSNVERFVRSFFEHSIDGYLTATTTSVETTKIRSAVVRVLKGKQDQETRRQLDNIYKTFSGYVHANYAHIMEMYNGHLHQFELAGIPSKPQQHLRMEAVDLSANSVLHAAAFAAGKLGLEALHREISQTL